jgi:hypothetical protein
LQYFKCQGYHQIHFFCHSLNILVCKLRPSRFLACPICLARPIDSSTKEHLMWHIGFFIGLLGIKLVCNNDGSISFIQAVCKIAL